MFKSRRTPHQVAASGKEPDQTPCLHASTRQGWLADQGDRPSAEAANLTRLGNYSLVYAILAAVADLGLLAAISTLGVPLDGAFGAIVFARLLFRLMAAVALILLVYTCICAGDFSARTWRRPALQFFVVAMFFLFCGIDHGDMTARTVHLLQWTAEHGYSPACCATLSVAG